MAKTEWRAIPGYEDMYEVSSGGAVRALPRIDAGGFFRQGKLLQPYAQKSGYLNVKLRNRNGERQAFGVHRLVAAAFLPNPDGLPQVNHKDEVKTNNGVSNLEWCSVDYNLNFKNGRTKRRNTLKANANNTKHLKALAKAQRMPVVQLTLDGQLVKRWPSAYAAGKAGYGMPGINDCCHHKRNTNHGYKWEFAS